MGLILRRLDDQDKRIRELEASESVVGNSMAKKTYVDDAVADAIHTMEEQTQALDLEQRQTRKKVNTLADNAIKDLTTRFQGLETKFHQVTQLPADFASRIDGLSTLPGDIETLKNRVTGISEAYDQEDKRRDEENRATERRWADELGRLETHLEDRIDEKYEEQERKLLEQQAANITDFNSYVDDALKRLHTDIKQDWWIAELERREKVRSDEMKLLLQQRPTHEDIANSYTTLATTSQVIDQVGDLHRKTGKEHHLLQSGLNTLERLYLRQLDSSAGMVSSNITDPRNYTNGILGQCPSTAARAP